MKSRNFNEPQQIKIKKYFAALIKTLMKLRHLVMLWDSHIEEKGKILKRLRNFIASKKLITLQYHCIDLNIRQRH